MKIPQAQTPSTREQLHKAYQLLGPAAIFDWPDHDFECKGEELHGNCPFHESKSRRSFKVNLPNWIFNCFGCDAKGTPIDYIWQREGNTGSPDHEDFKRIVDEICARAGVRSPITAGKHEEDIRRRSAALEIVYQCCHESLTDAAREYLHHRGLDDAAIEEFQLGYYPSFRAVLARLEESGFDRHFAEAAGILFPKMVGYATVPWRDSTGRPLTLYGVLIGDRNGQQPHKMALPNPTMDGQVWLRTKRAPLFLDRALKAGHRDLVLVEGVFDGLIAQAKGDDRVIACVAASPSYDMAEQLRKRRILTVTLVLDPDSAGDKGIANSVKLLSRKQIIPLVAPRLPDHTDPDEYILSHGIDAWREHTANTKPGWIYLAEKIEVDEAAPQSVRLNAFEGLVKGMPDDAILRYDMCKYIAQRCGYPLEVIHDHFCGNSHRTTSKPPGKVKIAERPGKPSKMAPFPLVVLPPVLRNFLLYVAASCSCDVAAPFMHLIAVLASLIGNTHRLKLRPDFVEPCILWTATIGESGRGKTPPFKAVLSILLELENRLQTQNRFAQERYKIEKAKYNLALKSWQKQPQGDPPEQPEPPPVLTAVTMDSTIEAIAWLHQHNWRGFLKARGELAGWVDSFGAYTGARGRDLTQWLELHDGASIKVDRKGADPETGRRTIYVPQTSISLTGTIQPGTMSRVFDDRAHDAGLVGRILLAWPNWQFSPWRDESSDMNASYRDKVMQLIHELYGLKPREEPGTGKLSSNILQLTSQAKSCWAEFYNDTRSTSFSFGIDEAFLANAWPKLLGAAARVAMILHLVRQKSDGDVGEEVDEQSMRAAIAIVEWLKAECVRIFELSCQTPAERERDELYGFVQQHGGKLTPRELMQKRRQRYKTVQEAEAGLNTLVTSGWGKWVTSEPGKKGGRPSTWVQLN